MENEKWGNSRRLLSDLNTPIPSSIFLFTAHAGSTHA